MVFPVFQVPGFEHVADQPEEPLVVDFLRQDPEKDLVVQADPKQSEMSPSMNQVVPVQVLRISRSAVWHPRPFRNPCDRSGELRLVVRLQQQADHFADQLIGP